MMNIIFLFVFFQLKHFLIDFPLQTHTQIQKKGQYGNLVGLGHSLEHGVGTMVVLVLFMTLNHVYFFHLALLLVLGDIVIHYHVDWLKMRFGSKNLNESKFWVQFGLDQLAHQFTYLGIVAILLQFIKL